MKIIEIIFGSFFLILLLGVLGIVIKEFLRQKAEDSKKEKEWRERERLSSCRGQELAAHQLQLLKEEPGYRFLK